mmetsp:Transcript_34724/g.55638  ORF Transcript_34724/g.55638 Transcript_34724/m.55638 type:complete len:129 (+) Transcript_34724:910-1296(+)
MQSITDGAAVPGITVFCVAPVAPYSINRLWAACRRTCGRYLLAFRSSWLWCCTDGPLQSTETRKVASDRDSNAHQDNQAKTTSIQPAFVIVVLQSIPSKAALGGLLCRPNTVIYETIWVLLSRFAGVS